MNKLTEKEKNKIVFDALAAIIKICSLNNYEYQNLSKEIRNMMIDCYIEGARRIIKEVEYNPLNEEEL